MPIKRRLRMELAGAQSPGQLAKEVRKRLTTMARSRSFVDWQGIRALAAELETQRQAIVETVAPADPKEALDPKIAAEIARRLLAAGRAEDALRTIEAAEPKKPRTGPGRTSNGKMPASACSTPLAAPRTPRRRGGTASSVLCRRPIFAPT